MRVEIMELIWQNLSVRDKVELTTTKSFLHFDIVVTKSVFSGDFITLREVVDSLKLVQPFVQVTLARACGPKDVPFVRIGVIEIVCFEN